MSSQRLQRLRLRQVQRRACEWSERLGLTKLSFQAETIKISARNRQVSASGCTRSSGKPASAQAKAREAAVFPEQSLRVSVPAVKRLSARKRVQLRHDQRRACTRTGSLILRLPIVAGDVLPQQPS